MRYARLLTGKRNSFIMTLQMNLFGRCHEIIDEGALQRDGAL